MAPDGQFIRETELIDVQFEEVCAGPVRNQNQIPRREHTRLAEDDKRGEGNSEGN